jgi:hypothetical protein
MGRVTKFAGPSLGLLMLILFHSISVRGQAENETTPGVPAESPQARNSIRVQSNEVVAPVSVTNSAGEVVLDLSQKDFHIFDNGVE